MFAPKWVPCPVSRVPGTKLFGVRFCTTHDLSSNMYLSIFLDARNAFECAVLLIFFSVASFHRVARVELGESSCWYSRNILCCVAGLCEDECVFYVVAFMICHTHLDGLNAHM